MGKKGLPSTRMAWSSRKVTLVPAAGAGAGRVKTRRARRWRMGRVGGVFAHHDRRAASRQALVPRLRLGTPCPRGSSSLFRLGRRSLPHSAFPGGAWEREGRRAEGRQAPDPAGIGGLTALRSPARRGRGRMLPNPHPRGPAMRRTPLLALLALAAPAFAQPSKLPSPPEMAAARTDVWGEAALRHPDGPSYAFFRDLLPPLRYVNTAFKHYPI